MKFGLHFGSRGIAGAPDTLVKVVQRAEALGYDYFGLSDHVVVATKVDSRYPYSETGKFFAQDTGVCMEQVTTLGFVAAATSRIGLLTSVLVLPHRHPMLTAKMLATLDVLSKGRLTLGIGVGWMAEELALLGAPAFADRARASEEYISAFRELWTAEAPRQDGVFARFDDLKFEPKPVQRRGPPIWVGGEVKGACRRAARLGDGWYPVATNPNVPLDTPQRYGDALDAVRSQAVACGRDAQEVQAALLAVYCRVGEEVTGREGARQVFTGSAQALVEDIGGFAERGLEHLVIGGDGYNLAGTLEHIERFAEEVIAKVEPRSIGAGHVPPQR